MTMDTSGRPGAPRHSFNPYSPAPPSTSPTLLVKLTPHPSAVVMSPSTNYLTMGLKRTRGPNLPHLFSMKTVRGKDIGVGVEDICVYACLRLCTVSVMKEDAATVRKQ